MSQTEAPYDDRPTPVEPELPENVQAPLARFNGESPEAPQWFKDAIAIEPERSLVDIEGGRIEMLTWGELGKPGLLLVHGNSAHADWWSFIAPILAKDYRVASISLAGMGASDWRERYAFDDFAVEADECAHAGGLYENGKPIYIGHSFGGGQVFYAAMKYPERMRAAILVDTGFGPPPDSPQYKKMMEERQNQVRNIPTVDKPNRVYPTMAAALARFRFMPPQPVENYYIADFIARRSLKEVTAEDGSVGYTWRFDPQMWSKLDRGMMEGPPAGGGARAPLAHIFGANSAILQRSGGHGPSQLPDDILKIEIPDSHHHVMVDQPLALIAAIRALLAGWPPAA